MSSTASRANASFAFDLLKKLTDGEDETKNVFFSPFSISSALAMTLLGARGDTAQQMSKVLHFKKAEINEFSEQQQQQPQLMQTQQKVQVQLPEGLKAKDPWADVNSGFKKLLDELNNPEAPYALSVANRLFGEQSYQFLKEYMEHISKHYGDLKSVDFKGAYEAVRLDINKWVEKQTRGKIKDFLDAGVLDSETKLVLVNAIYFKGSWHQRFLERNTSDAEFRINKTDKKQVKMMFQNDYFPLAVIPEANCQVLEMPYHGEDISMFIILPQKVDGLKKLETELNYDTFMKWTLKRMGNVVVQVKIPKFKLEEKYSLKTVLSSMGMVDAFTQSRSNFTGMSLDNTLTVSDVVHKAVVEVNEEGTEAAAATGVVATATAFIPPQEFTADHPFLFFIQHKPSRSILFAGRFCNPE